MAEYNRARLGTTTKERGMKPNWNLRNAFSLGLMGAFEVWRGHQPFRYRISEMGAQKEEITVRASEQPTPSFGSFGFDNTRAQYFRRTDSGATVYYLPDKVPLHVTMGVRR